MHRILALLLLASPAAFAGDLDRTATAQPYRAQPLGAAGTRNATPAFGFRFDPVRTVQTSGLSMPVQRTPRMGVRFDSTGFESFALRGIVMRQSGTAAMAGEGINPRLIAGSVAGSVPVIANEERKSPNAPRKRAGNQARRMNGAPGAASIRRRRPGARNARPQAVRR